MPTNRNNRRGKRKAVFELPAIDSLEEFEYNFCKYVDDAFPNKFRNTFVQQILNSISDSMKEALIGMAFDKNIFPKEKLKKIYLAIGNLYHVSSRINRLNDMQQISDDTKAKLDSKLDDIIDGLSRFANSLRNNISIAGQIPPGTPCGETGELEGCQTGCAND